MSKDSRRLHKCAEAGCETIILFGIWCGEHRREHFEKIRAKEAAEKQAAKDARRREREAARQAKQ